MKSRLPKAELKSAEAIEDVLGALVAGVAATTGMSAEPVDRVMVKGVGGILREHIDALAHHVGIGGEPQAGEIPTIRGVPKHWIGVGWPLGGLEHHPKVMPEEGELGFSELLIWGAHGVWIRSGAKGTHPLAGCVETWLRRPRREHIDERQDKGVLPRVAVVDNRKVALPDYIWRIEDEHDQAQLPLWPEAPKAKQVALLDLVDASNLPVRAKGRGAPLALRLAVWSMMALKVQYREGSHQLPVTLREIVAGVFPNGWNRTNQWPALRHELRSVSNYMVPVMIDGKLHSYHPLGPVAVPQEPSLDDEIRLVVNYLSGFGAGPIVDLPELGQLSVKSVGRFRAYIGAMSLSWKTGVTRRKSKGRWYWATNPDLYEVLTKVDRRRLAFGKEGNDVSQNEVDAAFTELPGMVVVNREMVNPRTGEVGWLVLPEDAAKAVTKPAGELYNCRA